MPSSRPVAPRVPTAVLATATGTGGCVMLPLLVLLLITAAHRTGAGAFDDFLAIGLPVLVGYPVAIVLWRRARQAATTRGAWILAGLGLAVLVAVSFRPFTGLAEVIYLQWAETQPGGRGYSP